MRMKGRNYFFLTLRCGGGNLSLGAETTRDGTNLRRRVVPVEIRWSIVAGGGSIFVGGVVVGGGGGQCFLTVLFGR